MSDVEHVEASVLAGPVPLVGWSSHVSEVTEVVSSEVNSKRIEGGSRAPPVVVGSVGGSRCGGMSAGSRVGSLTVGWAGGSESMSSMAGRRSLRTPFQASSRSSSRVTCTAKSQAF